MKNIAKQLDRQAKKVSDIIERREMIYSKRTKKWQESSTGIDHEEKTKMLIRLMYAIDDVCNDAEELI